MPSEFFLAHIWLIPLFPLLGAALMLLFGRRLSNGPVSAICVGSVGLAMVFAFGAFGLTFPDATSARARPSPMPDAPTESR